MNKKLIIFGTIVFLFLTSIGYSSDLENISLNNHFTESGEEFLEADGESVYIFNISITNKEGEIVSKGSEVDIDGYGSLVSDFGDLFDSDLDWNEVDNEYWYDDENNIYIPYQSPVGVPFDDNYFTDYLTISCDSCQNEDSIDSININYKHGSLEVSNIEVEGNFLRFDLYDEHGNRVSILNEDDITVTDGEIDFFDDRNPYNIFVNIYGEKTNVDIKGLHTEEITDSDYYNYLNALKNLIDEIYDDYLNLNNLDEKYTKESIKYLEEAHNDAKEVINDDSAEHDDFLDNIDDLNEARNDLVEISELYDKINEIENEDDCEDVDGIEDKLNDAKDLLEDGSEDDIQNKINDLNKIDCNMENLLSELNDLIGKIEEGDYLDDYDENDKANELKVIYDDAKRKIDDEGFDDSEDIFNKINKLNEKLNEIENLDLRSDIKDLKEKYNDLDDDLSDYDYSEDSLNELTNHYERAGELLDDFDDYTVNEITEFINQFMSAFDNLVEIKNCRDLNDGMVISHELSECNMYNNIDGIDHTFDDVSDDQICIDDNTWSCSAKNYCNGYWIFMESNDIILKNSDYIDGINCSDIDEFDQNDCDKLRCIYNSKPEYRREEPPSTYGGSYFRERFEIDTDNFDSGRNVVQNNCHSNMNESECRDELKNYYDENPRLRDCIENQDGSRFRSRYCRGVSSAITDLRSERSIISMFGEDEDDGVRGFLNTINSMGYNETAIRGWDSIIGLFSDEDSVISDALSSVNVLKEPLSRWNEVVDTFTDSPVRRALNEICERYIFSTDLDSTYGGDLIDVQRSLSENEVLSLDSQKNIFIDDGSESYFYYYQVELGNFVKDLEYGICFGNDNIDTWNDCDGNKLGSFYNESEDKLYMFNLDEGESRSTLTSNNQSYYVVQLEDNYDYISLCFNNEFSSFIDTNNFFDDLNDKNCISKPILDFTDKDNVPNYHLFDNKRDDSGSDVSDKEEDEGDKDDDVDEGGVIV